MKKIFTFLALAMTILAGFLMPAEQGVLANREYRRANPDGYSSAKPSPLQVMYLKLAIGWENTLALVPYFERTRAEHRSKLLGEALRLYIQLPGYNFQANQQAYMADVLRSSIAAISVPGGVSSDTARLYITQRALVPASGATGLNTDPDVGVNITVTVAAAASSSPVTLTVNNLAELLNAGEVIQTPTGVNLVVAANAAANATSVQVERLPVAIAANTVLSFKKWCTYKVRGELPNMAGSPRTATQETNVGQLTVLSGETDQQQTIQVFDEIDSAFVNSLDRASKDQNVYLGYMLFFPPVGGGRRKVITGYLQVGPNATPLGVNSISYYEYPIQRFGKPVHDERQVA